MKKEKLVKELLEINKGLYDLAEKLNNALCNGGGDMTNLYEQNDRIDNLIFKIVGIPKDNTIELDNDFDNPEYFCRDGYTDLIFDYCRGEEKIEKVVDKIINWNNEK